MYRYKKTSEIQRLIRNNSLVLIAETEGEVPHIDESWWDSLESIYPNIENLRIELQSD